MSQSCLLTLGGDCLAGPDKTGAERGGPFQVRLPRFVTDDDIGMGDLVKRATSLVGIKPCAPCLGRAAMLNRWIVFSPRRR